MVPVTVPLTVESHRREGIAVGPSDQMYCRDVLKVHPDNEWPLSGPRFRPSESGLKSPLRGFDLGGDEWEP